jgi:hypothetical protein
MSKRVFDLNIEEVLENWEVEHAIREVIANALDEQTLTGTADVRINKDVRGYWHIRDFGRGLRIEHFTLNEDKEKLTSELQIIGKFGVGLKDALATFHRRGVSVLIRSRHGTFRLREVSKHGFESIVTLHVEYDDTPQDFAGTDVVLRGTTDEDIARAKALFLKFAGERMLETTSYGDILSRQPEIARVYILGVLANEEPNFLFSYNITSLTDAMKKRLNRERLNVGRTTYTDRIKSILKAATSSHVKDLLADQVTRRAYGDQRDEMAWIEISQLAMNIMHEKYNVAYVTEDELQTRPDLVGVAKTDGLQVVVITEQQKDKAIVQAAAGGVELRTLDVYAREFNESFKYEFIDPKDLTRAEREVFLLTSRIFGLVDLTPPQSPDVRVSETMRITASNSEGVWDSQLPAIVIKRTCLSSTPRYAGTLLHEAAHATSGYPDVSRIFEGVLTQYLGKIAAKAL